MRGFILMSLLAHTLLYSETQTLDGVWYGGGQEIYTTGNEHYCLKPADGSTASFTLTNDDRRFKSCIYIALGAELGGKCRNDPTLEIENLGSHMYKIIVAPEEPADGNTYTLEAEYEGTFGRCPDYYQSNFLGMRIEDINFLLGIIGIVTALSLFASVIYTVLTLGNF